MYLQTAIEHKKDEFARLCHEHKVKKMYAFGSSVTNRFDEAKSDIDILVDVDVNDPAERGSTLLSLWDNLEAFFGRKVDLLTESSIKNPYLRANIERTRQLVYDRDGEKIFI